MSNHIKITIAAHCDKAAREHNEDNCLVCSNVASGKVDHIGDGTYLSPQIALGDKGCLLVVADGMGGMNAGEVASQKAVEAVRNFFSKDKLDEMSLENEDQALHLTRDAIIYADACVKSAAVTDSGKSGLGTTIVVLWILGSKAYIGWCGDSRIYRFNKQSKILTQLSKDHSYVQRLVDQHQITEDEAFDHPDSNVLLRSLGDAFEDVSPEILRPLNLAEDDVFMMCSDGLCGVLRNSEIRTILTRASVEYPIKQLNGWHELLWEHASQAGWHDNVTTVLCHITGCEPANNEPKVQSSPAVNVKREYDSNKKTPKYYTIIAIIAVAVVLGAIFTIIKQLDKKHSKSPAPVVVEEQVEETRETKPKSDGLPGIQVGPKEETPSQPATQKNVGRPKQATQTQSTTKNNNSPAQQSSAQSQTAAAPTTPSESSTKPATNSNSAGAKGSDAETKSYFGEN